MGHSKEVKSGQVTSEYYIEGAIMDFLRDGYESRFLGKWDFVARQYPASPPKPCQYGESMDLFGYRYVKGFPNAISKYLVIELKKWKNDIIERNYILVERPAKNKKWDNLRILS